LGIVLPLGRFLFSLRPVTSQIPAQAAWDSERIPVQPVFLLFRINQTKDLPNGKYEF